jgi:hypothetical protein
MQLASTTFSTRSINQLRIVVAVRLGSSGNR